MRKKQRLARLIHLELVVFDVGLRCSLTACQVDQTQLVRFRLSTMMPIMRWQRELSEFIAMGTARRQTVPF